ncbi:hypothetical protein TNCV_4231991 [Trichonephila clavipes]|nr:hypothetical protein TNCV_4231991 [Trichonephila clavipes]
MRSRFADLKKMESSTSLSSNYDLVVSFSDDNTDKFFITSGSKISIRPVLPLKKCSPLVDVSLLSEDSGLCRIRLCTYAQLLAGVLSSSDKLLKVNTLLSFEKEGLYQA